MADQRRLWAFLACRNKGSRLWGKPLQNLSIGKQISILDYLINGLKNRLEVAGIVLAISEGVENKIFIEYAKKHNIKYIIGDENDVLGRLVQCFTVSGATDALRISTESPFPAFEYLDKAWSDHINSVVAISTLDHVPDGCGFEIIQKYALQESHQLGEDRHRSELCTLYIRENKDKYSVNYILPSVEDKRPDLRLTVDYPEDLIIARAVFDKLSNAGTTYPMLSEIISFLETRTDLISLVDCFVEDGMKTMYR
jgi:spore coat polysaccharide biosynthesis protein SpsF